MSTDDGIKALEESMVGVTLANTAAARQQAGDCTGESEAGISPEPAGAGTEDVVADTRETARTASYVTTHIEPDAVAAAQSSRPGSSHNTADTQIFPEPPIADTSGRRQQLKVLAKKPFGSLRKNWRSSTIRPSLSNTFMTSRQADNTPQDPSGSSQQAETQPKDGMATTEHKEGDEPEILG